MPNSSNSNTVTPQQVYNTAWMLLIHGAKGLVYFVHKFFQSVDTASLLHDTAMSAQVQAINTQVMSLAPVLNNPTNTTAGPVYGVTGVPIGTMVKIYSGVTYVFAIGGRPGTTTGTFHLSGVGSATVIGESRTMPVTGGSWTDTFTGVYQVHLYQINAVAS
jgi:hypothetical protein